MCEEALRGLDSSKDRATRVLTELYAEGQLSTSRLESLLTRVHGAADASDVERVLASVGQRQIPIAPPDTRALARPLPVTPRSLPTAGVEPGTAVALASPDEVSDRDLVLAYQDGSVRGGEWVPARHVWVLNTMGGTDLDFREARFGPGVTEVSVFSFLGGVQILVPPTLQVEFDGRAVFGAYDLGHGARPVTDPAAPVLRINGVSIFSGVEVSVRLHGESERDAKRRRQHHEGAEHPGASQGPRGG